MATRTSTSRASSGSRTASTTDSHQPIQAAEIAARWVAVRRRIEDAAAEADRDPAEVRVVAVTKGFGPEVVEAALAAGLSRFGENRVQEGESKLGAAPDAEWHLVGHLQSNKVRRATAAFRWLHGVDSLKVLRRVDEAAHDLGLRPRVLLQVNVAEATGQHGLPLGSLADPQAVRDLAVGIGSVASAEVVGLMGIGPFTADPVVSRSAFAALRQLRDRLEDAAGHPFPDLSMGMSGDLGAAVLEGATLVRVGTALFGERPETD
jgi:pyridoxal phosphate enzyme (YggS family)